MEHMQEMAKMYLDWWETCWEKTINTVQTLEDMHRVLSSYAKTYEDVVMTSAHHIWK